jgi:transcriptional regulator with XRE-family HTH domain
MTMSTDIFPERLREARSLRGLSQEDVARKSGLQPSAVSHFESGTRKPSFDNLRKLADALDVTIDYLVGRVAAATGAVPAKLFRKVGQLSSADQELIEQMADRLGKLDKKGSGD